MSTKDDVFDYVMNSPEDTNPAVLRSLLNGIEEGGSGGVEDFILTFTITDYDENLGYSGTLDKTWDEIKVAYTTGKNVILRAVQDDYYMVDLKPTGDVYTHGELFSICFTSHIYPLFGDYEAVLYGVLHLDEGYIELYQAHFGS